MSTRDDFATGLRRLAREPGTKAAFAAFQGLHEAALGDGALDRRTKEMIAVAISVATHCEGCIAWHVGGALEAGATRDEVAEAVGVALMMGGGPATYYGSHALGYLDEAGATST